MKYLVRKGAQVNSNVLYMAASSGWNPAVEYILGEGVDPNEPFGNGNPLVVACMKCNTQTIVTLVEKGLQDKQLFSFALGFVVEQGDEDIARYLVSLGAKIIAGHLEEAVKEEHLELARFLFKQGPKLPDEDLAIEKCDVTIVRMLIDKGADVNGARHQDIAPLRLAVQKGNVAIVRMLLENGAEINPYGIFGWFALEDAVQRGDEGIVKALIDGGATINTDARGSPAL